MVRLRVALSASLWLITYSSHYFAEGTSCEMAGSERCLLGNCHCLHCGSPQLRLFVGCENILRHIRSRHRTFLDAYQQPMIYQSEAAPRSSIWYAGPGVGQILGGVVSYAFQPVKNPSFSGWKITFVVLGLVTAAVGFVTFFFLPDTPMKARFLSESEKIVLLKHVAVNQTGIMNKQLKLRQIAEVLLDIQLWLMVVLTILVGGSPCIKSLKLIHPYRS
jgi:hypothetical protein